MSDSTKTQALKRLSREAQAFQACFMDDQGNLTRDGEIVMRRLIPFCRVNISTAAISKQTGMIDPIAMGMAEGRREVWMLIQAKLELKQSTISRLLQVDETEREEYGSFDN